MPAPHEAAPAILLHDLKKSEQILVDDVRLRPSKLLRAHQRDVDYMLRNEPDMGLVRTNDGAAASCRRSMDVSMRRSVVLVAGALLGTLWWGVSWMLGAKAYGIWGAHPSTGLFAGIVTGVIMAAVSIPIYRRQSVRSLYWYSPLSVYLSIAIYGIVIFVLRSLIGDFDLHQNRWAVGLQSVFGMWWGITFLLPLPVAVQVLAYVSHRVLRKLAAYPP